MPVEHVVCTLAKLPLMFLLIDAAGSIQFISKSLVDCLGYSNSACLPANISALLPTLECGSEGSGKTNWLKEYGRLADKDGVLETCMVSSKVASISVSASCSAASVDRYLVVIQKHSEMQQLQRHILKNLDAERERISRDLHDSIGQELAGLAVILQNLVTERRFYQRYSLGSLSTVSEKLLRCVSHLRKVVFDLAPPILDGELREAIASYALIVQVESGINCIVRIEGVPVNVDHERDKEIFRIFQEAVINARKHAFASEIAIKLKYRGKLTLLEVEDNGKSDWQGDVKSDFSQGLKIMRYRAEVLGGKLKIAPGNGTRVRLLLAT